MPLTAEGVVLGVVRSYSAGPPRVAGVRLMGGLETLLSSVPVAAHVPGGDLTAGRECVVAFLEPNDVSSAVLVGVVGATVGSPAADHDHTGAGDGGVLTADRHDSYSEYAATGPPALPAGFDVKTYAALGALCIANSAGWWTLVDSGSFGAHTADPWAHFTAGAEQTIAAGVITAPGAARFAVDTEGDAVCDDLVTVNGGVAGRQVVVYPAHDDRAVVLQHGRGNIRCAGGEDIILLGTQDCCWLLYDGSNWRAWSQHRHGPLRMLDLADDFIFGTNAAGQLGELGWLVGGGSTLAVAGSAAHPGVVRLGTYSGSSTSAYVCSLGMGTTTGAINLGVMYWDLTWVVGVNFLTSVNQYFGAMWPATEPPYGVTLECRVGAGDTNWMAVVSGGAAGTTRQDTGVALALGWTKLRIRCIAPSTSAAAYEFYVGDVWTPQATISGYNWGGDAQLAVGAQIRNTTTTQRTVDLDLMRLRAWEVGR